MTLYLRNIVLLQHTKIERNELFVEITGHN